MAARWQDVAAQQADVIASRLRELLSTGLGLLHSKLGVDLGLKPEQYPSWVLLMTAFLGLLVIVVVWVAACAGLCSRRKRGDRASDSGSQATKTSATKSVKGAEQKKKNKKKPVEKKPQSNGRTILELQEDDIKDTNEILKQSEMKAEKQTKKNKKKTKAEVKPALYISSPGGKEPEDGAWETKISNREKKQQRRRDKVTEDSSLPGTQVVVATERPSSVVSFPIGLRKIKGEPIRMKPGKGEAIISQVSASWNEAPAVNGGGWNDMAMKLPTQMSGGDGETWTAITKAAAKRNPELAWGLELEGTGEADPWTTIADLQLESSQAKIDDQWSGTNGLSTVDPSSDWNAPAEEWGNWDDQKASPPPQPEGPAIEIEKVSDDEKKKVDSAAAAASGKSKKKKKKKKQQGEDDSAPVQETGEPEKVPSSELEVANSEPEMALPEEATRASEPVKVELKMERPVPVMTEPPVTALDSTSKNITSQVPQRLPEPEPPVSTTKQSNVPPLSQNQFKFDSESGPKWLRMHLRACTTPELLLWNSKQKLLHMNFSQGPFHPHAVCR
ncbi:protein LYRIC-like isoform X1 [Acipenser ruthenus]|uniref:protein LYRIC-like isoform X1 n=1 Tax=Acipenser ruthenus TaxID=7906 RepID=UPI002740CDC6|nr:protein LYRIC-like isoform X1 [Acipenser ruthenus]